MRSIVVGCNRVSGIVLLFVFVKLRQYQIADFILVSFGFLCQGKTKALSLNLHLRIKLWRVKRVRFF